MRHNLFEKIRRMLELPISTINKRDKLGLATLEQSANSDGSPMLMLHLME